MSERASEHLMRHYAGFIPCGGLKEVTPSPAASSPAGDTRPAIRTEYAGRKPVWDLTDEERSHMSAALVSKLKADRVPVRRLYEPFCDAQNGPADDALAASLGEGATADARTQAEAAVETALRATPDFALGFEDDPPLTSRELRWQAVGEIVVLSVISGLAVFVIAGSLFGLAVVFGWVG